MPRKSLIRLAGWLAIELAFAAAASAVGYDYNAAFVSYGDVRALALSDRQGHRVVIASAGFDVPLSVADMIAAQAIKDYHLERPDLLIYSVAGGDPAPQDAHTAIGDALGKLAPAYLLYDNGRLNVTDSRGRCLIALTATAALTSCTVAAGDSFGGRIRSAYQTVDEAHGLVTRENVPGSIALQAIALGRDVLIFHGPSNFAPSGKGIILAVTPAVEGDTRLNQAIGQLFLRVGGRPH